MTRVRCFALAILISVCCFGHTQIFAQSGQMAPGYGPGANFAPGGDCPPSPYQPFDPLPSSPGYFGADEVEPSYNRFGPLLKTDGGFVRVEYLNYNIGNPGHQLLGAPVAGVIDSTQPFVAFAPGTTLPVALATVPTTDGINLENNSGVQVTGGINFIEGGSIEVSAFMLARKQSGFVLDNLGGPTDLTNFGQPGAVVPAVIATSTQFNGQPSDHLLLYNQSYQAIMQSQLWGAEANYFYDYDAVGLVQFRPLLGVRYLNLSERLTQQGTFVDPVLGGAPIVSTIDAQTMNNLWGGQVGFRLEVVSKYLQVGITPKLLLLGDSMLVNVYSNHLRTNADPSVGSSDFRNSFSLGGDVSTYAQINVTPRFSLRAGYNFIVLSHVTRPQRDVVYNDNGASAPPAISSQIDMKGIFFSGFSLGVEYRF